MKSVLITAVVLCFTLLSCGEKAKEMQQAAEALKNISQNSDQIQKTTDEINKLQEERKAKGDTLAMPYKDLEQYLPASISGYKADDPSGESTNMAGFSYSKASRHYQNDAGNGVDVEIIDYNQTANLYAGVTALWALGLSVDNDEQSSKGFTPGPQYCAGYEVYHKKDKRSELTYALGGRFIMTIKADNQNSNDFAKSIGNSMKLEELSKK